MNSVMLEAFHDELEKIAVNWGTVGKRALIGAVPGAVGGAVANDQDRLKGALVGGLGGAAVGVGAGHYMQHRALKALNTRAAGVHKTVAKELRAQRAVTGPDGKQTFQAATGPKGKETFNVVQQNRDKIQAARKHVGEQLFPMQDVGVAHYNAPLAAAPAA